jgi:G6PDH family F420-dependent oxidoreductase
MKIGYTLSCEEFGPQELVKNAQLAEEAGFEFLGISDHFHPWIDEQGQSPFVWSVIGGIAQVTKKVQVFNEVNCPIIRYHPAIVAQAAATSQVMLQGRFILGVGTGENLNEHVVGHGWPPIRVRQAMLQEAVHIIRLLWQGGYQSFFGQYFTVDAARIYTLPEKQVPIIVSGFGPIASTLAGQIGDGFVTTGPTKELVEKFEEDGGLGKPKFAQMSVCYDKDPKKAKEIIAKVWPLAGMPKPLNTELRLPQDFKNIAPLVSPDEAAKDIPLGPDVEKILDSIQKYQEAGFDNIYVHNIGPNQADFIEFFSKKVMPKNNQHTPLLKQPEEKKSIIDYVVDNGAYSTAHQIKK